jgi:quercetin dioxygenase-like cupin family protein
MRRVPIIAALLAALLAALTATATAAATAHSSISEKILAAAGTTQPYTLQTGEPADVIVAKATVPPGVSFGWHSHRAAAVAVVKTGTLTLYDSADTTCAPQRFSARQGFVEQPNHAHLARNEGRKPIVAFVTYLGLKHGAKPRRASPAPRQLPLLTSAIGQSPSDPAGALPCQSPHPRGQESSASRSDQPLRAATQMAGERAASVDERHNRSEILTEGSGVWRSLCSGCRLGFVRPLACRDSPESSHEHGSGIQSTQKAGVKPPTTNVWSPLLKV